MHSRKMLPLIHHLLPHTYCYHQGEFQKHTSILQQANQLLKEHKMSICVLDRNTRTIMADVKEGEGDKKEQFEHLTLHFKNICTCKWISKLTIDTKMRGK